ncbi:MAG: hypothetical protein QOH57_3152 [Mycobacterium sp.]|jgi:hypothetical protein|nr:hypothetical protein [Mycobacterium sp.]
MNQRVPDSGGLPLRAMVMLLLFLAVIFLLLGLRAVFSGGDSAGQSSSAASTSATNAASTTATSAATGPKSPVFVYNISAVTGLAGNTAQQLKDAGWNAEAKQEGLDPAPPDVTATTVYFTDAAGEKSSAEEVAKILKAPPPLERAPELKDLQPGVIVIVTG